MIAARAATGTPAPVSRGLRWLFVSRRTGRIVVGQAPNALMLIVVAATGWRCVAPRDSLGGAARPLVRAVQTGSLAAWALDELLRGVNPFRRIGGGLVLAAVALRGRRW